MFSVFTKTILSLSRWYCCFLCQPFNNEPLDRVFSKFWFHIFNDSILLFTHEKQLGGGVSAACILISNHICHSCNILWGQIKVHWLSCVTYIYWICHKLYTFSRHKHSLVQNLSNHNFFISDIKINCIVVSCCVMRCGKSQCNPPKCLPNHPRNHGFVKQPSRVNLQC